MAISPARTCSHLTVCALVFSAGLSPASAQDQNKDDKEDHRVYVDIDFEALIGTCATFAENVEECRPGSCSALHPIYGTTEKPFIITRTVLGLNPDKTCLYTDNVPPDLTMNCNFTPENRRILAAKYRKSIAEYQRGEFNFSLSEAAKAPNPLVDCKFFRPDGSEVVMNTIRRVPKKPKDDTEEGPSGS